MSRICRVAGHVRKQIGVTTTHPPDVRLAKVFECRNCQKRWYKPDGKRIVDIEDTKYTLRERGNVSVPRLV